jgi:hypothetical protein
LQWAVILKLQQELLSSLEGTPAIHYCYKYLLLANS